ncbi:hypothetical protein ACS0TY_025628 [Phlomoides rotata]
MGGSSSGEGVSIEYTPTWVLALVCTVIVSISFAVERLLHYTGKLLVKKKQWPLFQALLKIKEELMLLGFISLLLAVSQERITTICIPKHLTLNWLPCHLQPHAADGGRRRLLAQPPADHCEKQGKAALLSLKALHDLHIFIFVLALVHVVFSVTTILFGTLKIRQWKKWEDSIQKKEEDPEKGGGEAIVTFIHQHSFIKSRFLGIGKDSALLSWVHSFWKQIYGSVNELDYTTLRRGFINSHYKENPKFNFYKYMVRALETDFKKVVGVSWYLWIVVALFLLLNVYGWHAYFWISFLPLILLLFVGTKLEHIITELGGEVAQRHAAVPGELLVKPSDHHFWFSKPRLVLCLIHIILFQNSFEIAVFFWVLVLFGFKSCIMGQIGYVIPRLVIGALVQFLCSYSTLPLYAIVAQMGSSFHMAIFEEHIQEKLTGWAQKAKMKKGRRKAANGGGGSSQVGNQDSHSPGSSAPLEHESTTTDQHRGIEIEKTTGVSSEDPK